MARIAPENIPAQPLGNGVLASCEGGGGLTQRSLVHDLSRFQES